MPRRRVRRLYRGRHQLLPGRGLVSDDTEHAAMVAQSLAEAAGEPGRFKRALARHLRLWLLGLPAGTGLATLRACPRLCLGLAPDRSGVRSVGNGPAMRAGIPGDWLAGIVERPRSVAWLEALARARRGRAPGTAPVRAGDRAAQRGIHDHRAGPRIPAAAAALDLRQPNDAAGRAPARGEHMPFTPLHMGPAAVLKAAAGRRFSFTVFGYSQILIDLEPLVRLVRAEPVLHGPSHSYAGALVIGGIAVATGKWACETGIRLWNHLFTHRWLQLERRIPWSVVAASAFIGTFSHVLLDSLMHADMVPFRPFSDARPVLGLLSHAAVVELCLWTGAVGGLCWMLLGIHRRARTAGRSPDGAARQRCAGPGAPPGDDDANP